MSCNCGATTQTDCTCETGQRGSLIRNGNGAPSIISTDLAGDYYIENDSTPAGEFWYFNGTLWTDLGYTVQGATGATGASGAVVEYNSTGSPTAFNSVGLTTIDTQNVTLETNGSYIEVENFAAVTVGSPNNHTKITIGGIVVWENFPATMGINYQKAKVRVTRVTDTTILYERWINIDGVFQLPILNLHYYNPSTDAVADMDTNPLTVLLQWGGIGTSYNLVITKYNA